MKTTQEAAEPCQFSPAELVVYGSELAAGILLPDVCSCDGDVVMVEIGSASLGVNLSGINVVVSSTIFLLSIFL